MSDHGILVELPDGTLTRKAFEDLADDDLIVFDGPDAFASTDRLVAELEAEIAAAGGLEAWRKLAPKVITVRARVFAIIPELRMAQTETTDGWQHVIDAEWHGDEFFDSLTGGAELELQVEDDDAPRVLAARIIT